MDYREIGVIANTHGLKGTLKIKPYTDFIKDRFKKGSIIYIKKQQKFLKVIVDQYFERKGLVFVDFVDFNSINEVEQFKGCDIFVHKEDIHSLNKNEFYYEDLVGLSIVCGEVNGVVKEVATYPASAMLICEINSKRVLIPFLDHFIKDVDLDNKVIYINEIEGLL